MLKNAEKQIADMSFFQSAVSGIENTELLGTVSINGTIVIRKIFQQEKMIKFIFHFTHILYKSNLYFQKKKKKKIK
mgnify:CR=1 FL=1